jgi:hypothetical protein
LRNEVKEEEYLGKHSEINITIQALFLRQFLNELHLVKENFFLQSFLLEVQRTIKTPADLSRISFSMIDDLFGLLESNEKFNPITCDVDVVSSFIPVDQLFDYFIKTLNGYDFDDDECDNFSGGLTSFLAHFHFIESNQTIIEEHNEKHCFSFSDILLLYYYLSSHPACGQIFTLENKLLPGYKVFLCY